MPELGDLLEIKTMLAETVVEWTQQWKKEGYDAGIELGIEQGELKGKLEGKLKGEATLLERLLTKRFGPLTPETRTRLNSATTDQLELWAERILDAPTVAAVFDGH